MAKNELSRTTLLMTQLNFIHFYDSQRQHVEKHVTEHQWEMFPRNFLSKFALYNLASINFRGWNSLEEVRSIISSRVLE